MTTTFVVRVTFVRPAPVGSYCKTFIKPDRKAACGLVSWAEKQPNCFRIEVDDPTHGLVQVCTRTLDPHAPPTAWAWDPNPKTLKLQAPAPAAVPEGHLL